MIEQLIPKETGSVDTTRQLCWIRFSHDGKRLLGGGYDALIRRWNLVDEELTEIDPIDGFHGWVQAFAQHPEEPSLFAADSWGRLACFDDSAEVTVPKWDLPSAHDGWIRTMSISHDGKQLATAGNDHHIRLFDTADGTLLHEVEAGDDDIFSVAIHPDGKSVVSGDLFCTLKAWNPVSGECTRELDARKMHFYDRDQDVCGLRSLRFLDEGRTLLAAGAEPTEAGRGHGVPVLYFYDWDSGELTKRLEQGDSNDGFIADLVTHPSGFFMSVTTGQPGKGKLIFHRRDEEKPFFEYTKMSNTHSIALQADGHKFFVAATNRNSQGNGAVSDKEGNYLGNFSPLHLFTFEN